MVWNVIWKGCRCWCCWHRLRVFPLGMPNGCRLCQERDGSRRRAVVFPCLWSQKVASAGGNLGKSRGGNSPWFALRTELGLARAANLCGAFSFRSKSPTLIPSMQTQWNICGRIHDISPEGSPSGHIKTNCSMLSAAPLTTWSSDHSVSICGLVWETNGRECLFNHETTCTLVLCQSSLLFCVIYSFIICCTVCIFFFKKSCKGRTGNSAVSVTNACFFTYIQGHLYMVWSTYASRCIVGDPHMEKTQKPATAS